MPLADLLEQEQNSNSKYKLFRSCLMSQNEMRYPQYILAMDLVEYISSFVLFARRKDGEEFEPTTP